MSILKGDVMKDLADLIARLRALPPRADDPLAAWRALVDHPWTLERLLGLAGRIIRASRPPATVEDLVQDAVMDLSRRNLAALDLERPCAEVGSFLRRLLGWEVRGAARRARGQECFRPLEAAGEPSVVADGSGEVRELIEGLSGPQRRVVELRTQGHTWDEVAKKTGMPLSSAYGQCRRARRTLEAELH
jgi:DNA-directed RNA polymerase specialized sigma24 family protein